MRVKINYELCEGHGRCFDNAYEMFDEREDGKGVAKMEVVPDDDFDMQRAARSAAMMCPMNAIEIIEDD
jgi:ferredoxin